jgi:Ca2+-binding EF-hand superfamily protein
MPRTFLAALTVLVLLVGRGLADDQKQKNQSDGTKPKNATITNVDPRKGTITLKYTDEQGKPQEKTFQLTSDVRLLNETGRLVNIDVFQSANEALIVEREGKLRELRRAPQLGRLSRLSDSVRTLIEMTDCDEGCTEDLQRIYDMLRKLDTGHNGKIDPKALKAEADNILQERVKEVFNRLDTNKDGKISKDEARGLIKEHFDQIDTNKDGFISYDELLKAAKERHEAKASDTKATNNPPKEKK